MYEKADHRIILSRSLNAGVDLGVGRDSLEVMCYILLVTPLIVYNIISLYFINLIKVMQYISIESSGSICNVFMKLIYLKTWMKTVKGSIFIKKH